MRSYMFGASLLITCTYIHVQASMSHTWSSSLNTILCIATQLQFLMNTILCVYLQRFSSSKTQFCVYIGIQSFSSTLSMNIKSI